MRVKIKETKVYEWAEMSEDQKDKAIEKLCDINVNHEWWDGTYDDAANIGLRINEFDIDRESYCKGRFTQAAVDVAKAILENHGKNCETYKTAEAYLKEYQKIEKETPEDEDADIEYIDAEFEKFLLRDYKIMLSKEYDYLTSRAAIVETIEANEYEFDEDGNIA